MDTKKLEALTTAVRLGSFTRAAEVLGYTQSGLTHMMNSLEKELGFALLVRSRAGVHLTAGGERIFPLIQDCLTSVRALEREVMLVNSGQEETIRVAAYASIAIHWLPEVIQRFRLGHPNVHVNIQMGSMEEVYRWVREDRVDMCFASRQESISGEWIHLRDDPLLVVLPLSHAMGSAEAFPVSAFDGQELLMPSPGLRLDIMRVMNSHGVQPVVRSTQISDSAIISMVEHGQGITILSELVLRGRKNEVLAVPLDPPTIRELGIFVRSSGELHPVARRFMTEAREIIKNMQGE